MPLGEHNGNSHLLMVSMTSLFAPLSLRGVHFPNRAWISPMCQYSAEEGRPTEWHLVHLGSRAIGGAGLVMVEATAVSPEGRISPYDLGIWTDEQAEAHARIAQFVSAQGSIPGIQIGHAGRKASVEPPWLGGHPLGGSLAWDTVAPSAVPFGAFPNPRAMTSQDLDHVKSDFVSAARRAWQAGFEVVEVHMAHGYLLHSFLSPLSNTREDDYGGDLSGRSRYPLEVVAAVRDELPDDKVLFVRISASDWADERGGFSLDEAAQVAKSLAGVGVDLIDCSSGGLVPDADIPAEPGYQVPFAERVRREGGIPTAAVGMLSDPVLANSVIESGSADAVFVARGALADPYWPRRAAQALGVPLPWPRQYGRVETLAGTKP